MSSTAARIVPFGIIGAGLMGREFASAAARWIHLQDLGVRPQIVAVADISPAVLAWYERLDPAPKLYTDYQSMLGDESVEAVYVAVPHHLHAEVMIAAVQAGKHLMGEKPFGIDLAANHQILAELATHPELFARCSSELPFYPGGQWVGRWLADRRAGQVIDVQSRFLHSSDLDPNKTINWKRVAAFNGSYGCLGDLGMHVLHLPLRAGFEIDNVRAVLSDIIARRPDGHGGWAQCDTWDNATLLCEAHDKEVNFPMRIETKRIAPGETNTWMIEINGTAGSVTYSTKYPKTVQWMDYAPGQPQRWQRLDLGSEFASPTITGTIFESGFSDAILQMWAAYLDELAHGHDGMQQPFHCFTPEETAVSHSLFTAALESHSNRAVVELQESSIAKSAR
jgi:predicted dehydrogenase